eukprot:g79258.t1
MAAKSVQIYVLRISLVSIEEIQSQKFEVQKHQTLEQNSSKPDQALEAKGLELHWFWRCSRHWHWGDSGLLIIAPPHKKKKGKEKSMEEYVQSLTTTLFNNGNYKASAVKLLTAILGNIINQPGEEKYRKINSTKVLPKLQAAPGAIDLLEALGFVREGDKLVFPQQADTEILCLARAALQAGHDEFPKPSAPPPAKVARGAPVVKSAELLEREAQLAKVQADNAAKIAALKAKKRKTHEKSAALFQDARKELKSKKIVASTANKLTFGRSSPALQDQGRVRLTQHHPSGVKRSTSTSKCRALREWNRSQSNSASLA